VNGAERRFICRACGFAHDSWAPRCAECLSLEGLKGMDAVQVAPTHPRLVCRACGFAHTSWAPRCVQCLSLEGLAGVEAAQQEAPSRPHLTIVPDLMPDPELDDPAYELDDDVIVDDEAIPLSEVPDTSCVRYLTGLAPLDHVLGGGLVAASAVLLASPRGIGKSSLTLQMLDGLGHRCLYVTGEETREQLAGTARRIGAASNKIYVFVERHIEKIFDKARTVRAKTIAIDSIQKMLCADVNGRAGSPGQVKECTARLVQYAKDTGTALWIIGHVTSDGDVAGPSTIEHDVDVVLELEQGTSFDGNERILRCTGKNRFGPANLTGSFELTGTGFVPVDGDGWDEKL
jgi:DNA repair protein RadA/Sms